MWNTWANLLTAVRLLAVAPAAWAIGTGLWLLAAELFVLAVLTDLLDGPAARALGQTSPVGGLFDHATDAAYVSVNLGALAWIGLINGWLPVLVALAFVQYVFDSKALAGAELKTSFLGRINGIAYFVMVGIPVMREALGLTWPDDVWIRTLAWILVATTLASMLDRAVALARTSLSP
ncbi:MAG: CDP-alcohol phosphatidyltransferase family protein [Gammaproteobacteria bacterium]|jgi:phosphatidylglycerophosphate synthase